MRHVDTRTIHPPQARCGTNNKRSTRKASSVMSNVGIEKTRMPMRNLGECEGAWKCAAIDITNIIRVRSAAIGWTMSMEESDDRAPLGSENSESIFSSPKRVFESGDPSVSARAVTKPNLEPCWRLVVGTPSIRGKSMRLLTDLISDLDTGARLGRCLAVPKNAQRDAIDLG